jgi:N-methylhydantoinase A
VKEVDLRIAIDIGGTFTDAVAESVATGELILAKRLTTYADPSIAVSEVVDDLLRDACEMARARGQSFRCVEVVHGTTLVTNAIIERDGAKTALFATAGTADVLDIGREVRYDLYDLDIVFPQPLVPRRLRFEVDERIDGHGRVIRPLDEQTVRDGIRRMKDEGVTAVAVTLLHGYQNPIHELRIQDILRSDFPEAKISLSSRVASEIREYERTSTTVANAFVQPLAAEYIRRLKSRMSEKGIDAPLRIMTSNGGFTSDDTAAEVPIELLESGPAGGVRGGINTAGRHGLDKILTFDMGGTTAKACVCLEGEPDLTYSFEAARVARFRKGSGLPILVPSIDLIEIGAGGGSIAYRNSLGLMNVGPQSAGSEPGPACYGLGGDKPTVTDADLVLGYLDQNWFLGGRMPLDLGAARDAIAGLGKELGLAVEDTAWGIHDVVNENMAGAARVHAAEKGLDPRNLTMVATGGAGPVHAVEVAAKLGVRQVVFTLAAGVGSCLGFLAAPARMDRSWSYVERIDQIDLEKVRKNIARLDASIREDLHRSDVEKGTEAWTLAVEMRYAGQGHGIIVTREYTPVTEASISELADQFEVQYQETYGTRIPNGVPQTVTWRLSAQSKTVVRDFRLAGDKAEDRGNSLIGCRRIFEAPTRSYRQVPVHDRYAVRPGTSLRGPLIMAEAESTIVVARSADVTILDDGAVRVVID